MSEDNNNSGEGDNANKGDNKGQNSEGDNGNNAGNQGDNGNGNNNNAALSQKQYEDRIAELDKRDKAMDEKLQRMEKLNEKITAEGSPTGGQAKQETADEKQKATLVKQFGGCIDGLDKML